MSRWKLVFLTVILAIAGLLATPAQASPQPTVGQIKHEITVIQNHVSVLDQQYDALLGQISAAKSEVSATTRLVAFEQRTADQDHQQVVSIASALMENYTLQNPALLITGGNIQQAFDQTAIAQELTVNDAIVIHQYATEQTRLSGQEQVEHRQQRGASELAGQAGKLKGQMQALTAKVNALTTPAPNPGASPVADPLPASSQAGKAVAFAYAQLGCPYVYGGTGPCNDGFDCSGLVMQAWASAGVSIPRTTFEQWASLPTIPESEMAPGDLLIVLGGDHVGMYVGNGEVIAAPQPGMDVTISPFAGWWQQSLDAVLAP
jgi:peptidoglycan DL-endopeptidase CwlO